MNPALLKTQPYPFERLKALLESVSPAALPPIKLTVGEPQHEPAACAINALAANATTGAQRYPLTRGSQALRESNCQWLLRRFGVQLNAQTEILPVNGTREALFAIAQTVVDAGQENPTVIVPNPFYQIYEGAAILAGATPWFWSIDDANGLPSLEQLKPELLANTQLLYICSPANPNGAVAGNEWYARLLDLAHRYDFVIAADECYAEIYDDKPPPSLLNTCLETGDKNFSHCLVFHSLSKRSNLPGLRSGFVAGDARLIAAFAHYRTYHGSAMSPVIQAASSAAWADDEHVEANRGLYREKFSVFGGILQDDWPLHRPAGGFYFWGQCKQNSETVVRALYESQNVTLLPGSYLARDDEFGRNPGSKFVRIALTASSNETHEAARRIKTFCQLTDGTYL